MLPLNLEVANTCVTRSSFNPMNTSKIVSEHVLGIGRNAGSTLTLFSYSPFPMSFANPVGLRLASRINSSHMYASPRLHFILTQPENVSVHMYTSTLVMPKKNSPRGYHSLGNALRNKAAEKYGIMSALLRNLADLL